MYYVFKIIKNNTFLIHLKSKDKIENNKNEIILYCT